VPKTHSEHWGAMMLATGEHDEGRRESAAKNIVAAGMAARARQASSKDVASSRCLFVAHVYVYRVVWLLDR